MMPETSSGDIEALAELIAELDAASSGTRELDIRIEYCVGVVFEERTDIARILVEEGFTWNTVGEALDGRVPPYTASLDAAVPGENIVFSVRSDRRGKWGAVHRDADGREYLVWAANECLARRLAGLKGRYAALTRPRVETAVEPRVEPGLEPSKREPASQAAERDWKVMF